MSISGKVAGFGAVTVAVLAALYTAAGVYGVPKAAQLAAQKAETLTGGRVKITLGDVSFNPWTWTLDVRDIALAGASKDLTNVRIARLFVDASFRSVIEQAPVLESLHIEGLSGKTSVPRRIAGLPAAKTSASESSIVPAAHAAGGTPLALPRFCVNDLSITNGNLEVRNTVSGETLNLKDVMLRLPAVSTLGNTGAIPEMKPELSLRIDETPIAAKSRIEKDAAYLDLDFSNLDAAKIARFAQASSLVSLPVTVQKAALSVKGSVRYDFTRDAASGVSADARVTVADVDVREKAGNPLARVASIEVDAAADLSKRSVDIRRVLVKSPSAQVNARVGIPGMARGKASQASETPVQAPQVPEQLAGWKWKLAELSVENGSVTITDRTIRPVSSLPVTNIALTARDLSSDSEKAGHCELTLNVAGGKIATGADVTVPSRKASVTTNLTGLQLSSLNPWANHYARVTFSNGALNVHGKGTLDVAKSLQATWKGSAGIAGFEARKGNRPLASWQSLSVEGIDLKRVTPPDVHIERLTVKQPAQAVTKKVDKVLKVASIFAQLAGKSTERIERIEEKVSQDLVLENLEYDSKGFRFGNSEKGVDALQEKGLKVLNQLFGKRS